MLIELQNDKPERSDLLSKVCPDAFDEKYERAYRDGRETMKTVALYCSNLKRKDYKGKLKELISSKMISLPLILRERKGEGYFIVENVGIKDEKYKLLFPTKLFEKIEDKTFFRIGEVYLFKHLEAKVIEDTKEVVFIANSLTAGKHCNLTLSSSTVQS